MVLRKIIIILFCLFTFACSNEHKKAENEILISKNANIDKDSTIEQLNIIRNKKEHIIQLQIYKNSKLIKNINFEEVEPLSATVKSFEEQNILNTAYNQIILKLKYKVYGRGESDNTSLFIISYVSNDFKIVLSYDIERKYHDKVSKYDQYIKYNYVIKSGEDVKIIFNNISNVITTKNINLPKLPTTDIFIWNGQEFVSK